MTARIWLNSIAQVELDLADLLSPTWLRQLILARRTLPGWEGPLLG